MRISATARQLELAYDEPPAARAPVSARRGRRPSCSACREREVGNGRWRPVGGPYAALCFECFRREIDRLRTGRQAAPFDDARPRATRPREAEPYQVLAQRRRHAQIAARHALDG